jgi:transcriptional regulator with XRE-family HTH domain
MSIGTENFPYLKLNYGGEYVIYDNVKRVCDEKGISVGKLEKELDLSNGSICKWNESEPGIRKVQKVADYLGVSIEELLK